MLYNFEKIEKIIFFGGSIVMLKILEKMTDKEKIAIFSSTRFLNERINKNMSFKEYLEANNFKYYDVEDINNCEVLENEILHNKTLGFSISASWIIKKNVIEMFNGKIINIHGSRLPQNKGGGGLTWNILQDSCSIGNFAFHFITPGIDDGDIIHFFEFKYPKECKVPLDFYEHMHKNMVNESLKLLDKISKENDFKVFSQTEHMSIYWPRIDTKTNGYINWSWSLNDIYKFINAFDEPYLGASTYIGETKIRLKGASIEKNDGIFHPYQKGIIYRKNLLGIFIATENGTLVIEKIYDEDGNDYFDKIRVGYRLYTPSQVLDLSMSTRVFF